MQQSRLPIDVCEHIIDACYRPVDPRLYKSYKVLRHASLVCSAWLPRSRLNLYYYVDLNWGFRTRRMVLNLFMRTLQENPHYGGLVRIFEMVDDASDPAGTPSIYRLPKLLSNCVALYLTPEWHDYSPRYIDTMLCAWSRLGIVKLSIMFDNSSTPSMVRRFLRFLGLLRQLEDLTWIVHETIARLKGMRWQWPTIKSDRCEKLRSLTLVRLYYELLRLTDQLHVHH
ncbi:hypothetical protein C8Q76DRAFT_737771 [Earliella scabrosa]|nr:hypothetical protein C8Q76DRAFT_737771 [Earliella scabrosa]